MKANKLKFYYRYFHPNIQEVFYSDKDKKWVCVLFKAGTSHSMVLNIISKTRDYFNLQIICFFQTYGIKSWDEKLKELNVAQEDIIGRTILKKHKGKIKKMQRNW